MEKNQAVDGVEEAEVLEIIDHHRLSSIETMGPVIFPKSAGWMYRYDRLSDVSGRGSRSRAGDRITPLLGDHFRYPDVSVSDLYTVG